MNAVVYLRISSKVALLSRQGIVAAPWCQTKRKNVWKCLRFIWKNHLFMQIHFPSSWSAALKVQPFSVMWQTRAAWAVKFLCEVTFPGYVQIKCAQKRCHRQRLRWFCARVDIISFSTKSLIWHKLRKKQKMNEGFMNPRLKASGQTLEQHR